MALGAGEEATLDLSGDGFLSVAIPSSMMGKLVNAHGALVGNRGKIIADGSTVYLSAATAANILRNAVDIPGSVRTNTVGTHNGKIVINGGDGRVRITGRLAANGGRRQSGGRISIWGDSISVSGKVTANGAEGGTISAIADSELGLSGTLMAEGYAGAGGEIDLTASNNVTLTGATVNASGTTGGGTINIGGGPHATVALADAQSVTIDAATTIDADATDNGNGGRIVVWSDGLATALGTLSATGGPNGGNGGLIETSGQSVNFDGITVNTSAPRGSFGTWLVDPTDLIIDSAAANTISADLATTDVGLGTSDYFLPSGPGGTTGDTQNGNGDIMVDSALSWNTNTELTLSAYHSIDINADITVRGGGTLVLETNSSYCSSNGCSSGSGGSLNIAMGQGDVQFTGGASAGAGLVINNTPYTLLYNMTAIEYIGYNASSLGGNYALATSLDAADGDWTPIGAETTGLGFLFPFSGVFQGLGNTIANLTVNEPTSTYVGLFGQSNGTIENVGLTNVSITGGAETGALVGDNIGTITNTYATGAVSGQMSSTVGGLVGSNTGTISQSFATVNVSAGSYATVGGLVGYNNYVGYNSNTNTLTGTISQSFATGNVTAGLGSTAGGLVGANVYGTIADTYAMGAVHAGSYSASPSDVGGLVGYNESELEDPDAPAGFAFGSITRSYATGAVSVASSGYKGGLVGYLSGSGTPISDSYFDSDTTGTSVGVGGFYGVIASGVTGETTSTLQTDLIGNGIYSDWSTGIWTTGLNGTQTYPYFNYSPPIVISGNVYSSFTTGALSPVAGISVSDLIDGVAGSSSVTTDGSGAYSFYTFGPALNDAQIVVYTGTGANSGAAFAEDVTGAVSGLNIYGGYLAENTAASATQISTVAADFSTAVGSHSSSLPSTSNLLLNIGATTFAVDRSIGTGTLVLNSAGTMTQSAAMTATDLDLLGTGAIYTLTDSGNNVGTLAADVGSTGAVSFYDGTDLTIGSVDGTDGITAGSAVVTAAGDLTIAFGDSVTGSASGDAVILAATGDFINDAGSGAVSTPSGNWLVYSANPNNDTFGPSGSSTYLNSSSAAIWDATYVSLPPASVPTGPNYYIFAYQPKLTFTADSPTITYGDPLPTLTYSVSGYYSGDGAGTAFTADATLSPSSLYSGTPNLSTTAGALPTVVGGPTYPISTDVTPVTAITGYAIAGVNGTLTVNPAQIVVTALGGSSTYGQSPSNPGLSAAGLQNGESVSVLTGLSNSFGIGPTTGVAGSSYTLTVNGALTNPNYTVTSTVNGSWIVNPAQIVVTALGGSSTYGQLPNNPGLSAAGLQNGENVGVLTGLSNSFGIGPTTGVAGSPYTLTVNGTLTNPNYTVTSTVNGSWIVNPAALTITADNQTKTYGDTFSFAGIEFTTSGLLNGDSVTSVSLTSAGAAAAATVGTPGPTYAINGGSAVGSGLGNYTISYVPGTLTVDPASIVVTAQSGAGSSIYGQSPTNPGLSAAGLQNGQTVGALTGLANSFAITNTTNVGTYGLSVVGTLTNPNYTITGTVAGSWTVNPATLTYVADPSTQFTGVPFQTFTGTVTGFVNGETLASATTGVLSFTSSATPSSSPGSYAINGSGLIADDGNYLFVQAPRNATALTLDQSSSNSASQFGGSTNGSTNTATTINFTTLNDGNFGNNGTPINIAFTPNTNTNVANNQNGANIIPGALPPGVAFTHNHGLIFLPISQYDPNQYSNFKLPPYDSQDSEAAIFTIIARAAEQATAADYMIDGFWNGTDPTWPGAGHVKLLDQVTFSDGGGHGATPTNDPAFPIVAGKTDFAALLKNGPVMIGGAANHTPEEWLLSVSLALDGKGLICDDTITGKFVELAYNPITETLGGITGVFDPKTKGFVVLADASGDIPAAALNGLAALQSFVPSTYFAITVH